MRKSCGGNFPHVEKPEIQEAIARVVSEKKLTRDRTKQLDAT
jgi:hypothetical protein